MASPSLLQSTSSSIHGQRAAVRFPALRSSSCRSARVLSVRAAKVAVLVDKSEVEKVHRLKTAYLERIVPVLNEEFSYTNVHQVPKVEKIVVNCGIGDAAQNAKGLDAAMNDLALITGQRPVKTRAKRPIASFKIRQGQILGIKVTLRGKAFWVPWALTSFSHSRCVILDPHAKDLMRTLAVCFVHVFHLFMYAFLDRLINLALPRTRDFQGVSPNSFDGHGNYSIGFSDQGVFPEINPEVGSKARGMDVCIKTTAKTDKEGFRLLELMGMPFKDDDDVQSDFEY
ncbi:hypothetical protein Cgig2_033451 [Carnegiea gigantea]|uniref:Large ribosomal subunit protein uL5c n=1 Tax=Carnegiea gigantea TaxID=171969 RepID=A0A9Q1KX87_9CARY|nr:hypothetical protein Cgig2_033451 [Carnegiea gigantea]